jgi:hypothetical protein
VRFTSVAWKKLSPMLFKRIWERWKKIARAIGDFQARIILMIFYFVILAPFAFILRLAGDPLGIKHHHGWHDKKQDASSANKQF